MSYFLGFVAKMHFPMFMVLILQLTGATFETRFHGDVQLLGPRTNQEAPRCKLQAPREANVAEVLSTPVVPSTWPVVLST